MGTFPITPKHMALRGRRRARRGMTLLELTAVIPVLLSLISILFVGAQAWKRGSDRTLCIRNLHNVEKGLLSSSKLYGYGSGQRRTGLQRRVVGRGKFVEKTSSCSSAGTYTYAAEFGVDTMPPVGQL
jgi:hypothetical protein